MTHPALRYVSRWYGWIPFAAALVLAFAWGQALGTIGVLLVSVSLVGAVSGMRRALVVPPALAFGAL